MRITITNLGPVRRIVVDLRDLTVFTGPNNTGKSVVSTVLAAALAPGFAWPAALARSVTSVSGGDEIDVARELDEQLEDARDVRAAKAPSEQLLSVLEARVTEALDKLGGLVITEIERAYGASAEAVRRKKNRVLPGRVLIESTDPEWALSIEMLSSGPRTVLLAPPSFDNVWRSLDLQAVSAPIGSGRAHRGGSLRAVVQEVLAVVFREFPDSVRYLPAARSGMMQSQKLLAGSIVRSAGTVGAHGLSGVVSDFLGEMIEIDPGYEGDLFDLGVELEGSVLGGEVLAPEAPGGELLYRTASGDFPIPRTSSMVSELAPIVLLLKHSLEVGDLLIVEEPEAHLHPESQIELANVLVKTTNRGVRLLLTTHSEFFLQQLTNAIAGSAAHTGVPAAETILADRVSAYWFAPTDNGVVGEPLTVTVDEGIPDGSFSAVAERLHNQYVRLELARDESA